jgi:hypothetical protein
MSKLDAKRAREILEHHFATITNEELIENLRKWVPRCLKMMSQSTVRPQQVAPRQHMAPRSQILMCRKRER